MDTTLVLSHDTTNNHGSTSAESAEKDELCSVCSKIDLFSLFTGPRHYSGRPAHEEPASAMLATLAEVRANSNCPLCRLIKHGFEGSYSDGSWAHPDEEEPNPGEVYFKAKAIRTDHLQSSHYVEESTRNMVASMLRIILQPRESTRPLFTGEHWIQLHSPDSFDPSRPLLNGHLATSMEKSLALLRSWIDSCIECHGEVCNPRGTSESAIKHDLRCIETRDRKIVHKTVGQDEYAALSYVWGKDQARYIELRDQLVQSEHASIQLPPGVPRVIEDAICVCQALEISYLWVDLYCVEQRDSVKISSEIQAMGQVFRNAKIVLIAGFGEGSDSELLPSPESQLSRQRTETVQGHMYVTAAPNLLHRIQGSDWNERAWTMQEGQLARRAAFFGAADISFLCGSGHWRESLHSGGYGHDATLPGINLSSDGFYLLSASRWLRERKWYFSNYNSLLMAYTTRNITYEFDRLNAIAGCLNTITEATGVGFVSGLPLSDFHYALLWEGEYDRPRSGFPSWSWLGWHCLQQSHRIYPMADVTCQLVDAEADVLKTKQPESCEVEMSGLLISLTERAHTKNKCAQVFADISLARSSGTIAIDSYSVHFSIDISPSSQTGERNYYGDILQIPPEFDSRAGMDLSWDLEKEYPTPYERISLRDQYGNTHIAHYPLWFEHWPPFMLAFPSSLRGSSIQWLLKEGIEMIEIIEAKLVEAPDTLKPFHNVLCLGLDRRAPETRRFGMFCIPKEIWEIAGPKPISVTLG